MTSKPLFSIVSDALDHTKIALNLPENHKFAIEMNGIKVLDPAACNGWIGHRLKRKVIKLFLLT